ncbi:ornithine carbamoyltransferase [Methanobrevibacter boviskoreani]|uniref:ornithine carbamoyltransferase n=1 Tax=Methanobrevibacter boviskoreani TaxID=1348249 RepID=UPI0023F53ACF|nr:ornithine carbamoyltransferase [Methanobrevibacter boviskoreani]MDD6257076.1 ornithine carbamoyltransferase [Methanobrevibacter boviskoreani]
MNSLLSITDLEDNIENIINLASDFKDGKFDNEEPLKDKKLAMIFQKSSTRTRVSFEVGMYELGGTALFLSTNDIQLGRGEPIKDTAKVLSRYVDGIMIRATNHADVVELAEEADIPVINGLTDVEHPCQAFADILTIKEHKGDLNRKLTFVGDGNNVSNSLLLICAYLGMDFAIACPKGYEPDKKITEKGLEIAKKTGSTITITPDLELALKDADAVYTDVWVSMGEEEEAEKRNNDFAKYQVNEETMKLAKDDAIFMHCLPAIRGKEVTSEVIDGPQSVIYDQAENRLHAQKAIMYHYLKD